LTTSRLAISYSGIAMSLGWSFITRLTEYLLACGVALSLVQKVGAVVNRPQLFRQLAEVIAHARERHRVEPGGA